MKKTTSKKQQVLNEIEMHFNAWIEEYNYNEFYNDYRKAIVKDEDYYTETVWK